MGVVSLFYSREWCLIYPHTHTYGRERKTLCAAAAALWKLVFLKSASAALCAGERTYVRRPCGWARTARCVSQSRAQAVVSYMRCVSVCRCLCVWGGRLDWKIAKNVKVKSNWFYNGREVIIRGSLGKIAVARDWLFSPRFSVNNFGYVMNFDLQYTGLGEKYRKKEWVSSWPYCGYIDFCSVYCTKVINVNPFLRRKKRNRRKQLKKSIYCSVALNSIFFLSTINWRKFEMLLHLITTYNLSIENF